MNTLSLLTALSSTLLSSSMGGMVFNDSGAVNQGDKIVFHDGYCTVGWGNDGYILTNAHCAEIGDGVYNTSGNKVGTVIEKPDITVNNYNVWTEHDWAVIELQDGIDYGGNSYSGENMIAMSDVEVGDEICRYGSRTQRVMCSNVIESNTLVHKDVVLSDDYTSKSGDSGGPAWITDKGFIGLHRGATANYTESVTTPILNVVPDKYL